MENIKENLCDYNLWSINFDKNPCWPISEACKKCASHPNNGAKGFVIVF